MTSLPNRWPSPRGIEVTVSFPRWIFRLAALLVGLFLVLGIIGGILTVSIGSSTSGGSSFAMSVTGSSMNGLNQRFTIDVRAGTESNSYPDNGWSVLLEDGSILPARVVSGPERLTSNVSSRVQIEVGTKKGAAPVAVRFDPDGKLGMSLPLR